MRARRSLQAIVIIVLWGLITHGTHAGTGDEPHYLAIAHSIAFDGDLDLANNYGANEPLVGGGVLQPEAHVRPGVDGAARPVHDIGMPVVFAPFVRLAVPLTNALTRIVPESTMRRARLNPSVLYRHLLSLAMIALAAVLAGLLFDALVALGASAGAALGTAALLMLSPPLLIFSVLFFTELPSALVCFAIFYRICFRDSRGAARWWWIGCATGFLFLLHANNVGLIIPLAALALYRLRDPPRRREAVAFVAGAALLVAVRVAVNYVFWGGLLSGPHARLGEWPGWARLIGEMTTRLVGLLVDQEFGILIYAPVYVLAIWGAISLGRVQRDLTFSIFLVVGVYVGLVDLPANQRARLDRRLEPRGTVPDANHPARRPVCVRGTADRTLGGRGYRRRPADGRQRLCLAASQDPVERRRRPRGLLRAARRAHLRLFAVDRWGAGKLPRRIHRATDYADNTDRLC